MAPPLSKNSRWPYPERGSPKEIKGIRNFDKKDLLSKLEKENRGSTLFSIEGLFSNFYWRETRKWV